MQLKSIYSQIHPDDDNVLAVLLYTVGPLPSIKHSASSPHLRLLSIQFDHSQQSSSSATRTAEVPRWLYGRDALAS